jgi:BMFP domain-containing protein YqiC
MQTENRLLDDLARMANGALNTLSGVREEIESRVRERVERMLADMDMVPREEFEAVRAMAQTARSEQEDLAARVAELERRLSVLSATVQPATATAATGKPAAKPALPKKPKPAVTRSRSAGVKTAAKPTSE